MILQEGGELAGALQSACKQVSMFCWRRFRAQKEVR